MNPSNEVLSPERVAAALAPIIDRLRLAIARRAPEAAHHLLTDFGLSVRGLQTLAMLRNTMPDRVIGKGQVFDVFLYTPQTAVADSIGELTAGGLVDELTGDRLRLSPAGRWCVAGLYACTSAIVDDLWSDHAALVSTLVPVAAQAAAAAEATGGRAFAVMAPAYEPDGVSAAMLLAERLTPLRFHRFDSPRLRGRRRASRWSTFRLCPRATSVTRSRSKRTAVMELLTPPSRPLTASPCSPDSAHYRTDPGRLGGRARALGRLTRWRLWTGHRQRPLAWMVRPPSV